MARKYHTIWDGVAYRQVSPEEAAKLVKEDKAQDCSERMLSATELKFRRDFKGYQTREVRADTKVGLGTSTPDAKLHVEPKKKPSKKASKKKASKKKAPGKG